MSTFANWLIGFVKSALIWLYNMGIDFLQALSDGLVTFILVVVGLFPEGSPLPALSSAPASEITTVMLQTLNWLFPVSYLLTCVAWLSAGMLAYICIAPLARWLKLLT